MKTLALKIPGYGGTIDSPVTQFHDLNGGVSLVLQFGIYIAFFLALSWMAWGVFQYIFAGGNKENLARARARIMWSIIGLVFILIAFAISRFIGEVFNPTSIVPVTVTP